MKVRKSRLILVIVLGIAAVAIALVFNSWQTDPIETAEQSGNSTNRIASTPEDPVQVEQEIQSQSAETAEIDPRLREQLASMPRVSLDEYQTAGEALQSIEAWSEMSPRDVQQNARAWKQACEQVRTPKGHFPPMLETESFRTALEEFESFCSGIEKFEAIDAPSLESAEDVDELFDRIERARVSEPESWSDKIERLGREGALEAAFDRLESAIRNLNEDKTRGSIRAIISSGLYPQIEETGPESRWTLSMLEFPLAHALLCQRMDGCTGTTHPYVVKYCLMEYKYRNRYCDSPNSINDAIYQTLTPVEFDSYLPLYGWLTSQLARWSD